MDCKVDALRFSVAYDCMQQVLDLLPGEMVLSERGYSGYTHSGFIAGGYGRVGWSPDRPEMKAHFELKGKALAWLGSQGLTDWPLVIALVQGPWEGHFTRFDVAWDDREGVLSMPEIEKAVDERLYSSRARGRHVHKSWNDAGELGRTVEIGKRVSSTFLRIYDKAVEQGVEGPWVRVEMELKSDRANAAAREWSALGDNLPALAEFFTGLLRSFVEFKRPGENLQRCRWKVAEWWRRFLKGCKKARLAVEVKPPRTLADVLGWIENQVGPSLAVVVEALGFEGGWGWLYRCSEDGRERWGDRHRAILLQVEGGCKA